MFNRNTIAHSNKEMQQIHTNSQVRTIDPRVKILQSLVIGFMLFAVKTDAAHTINVVYLTLTLLFFGMPVEAVRFCGLYIVLYSIYFLCGLPVEWRILNVFSHFAYFALKILPMMAMALIMTKTITPAQLIGAFQKVGIHKNLTIPLAVALRFLPSLGREIGYIRDAMKMRGIYTGLVGVVKSPTEMLEYITVPLLMRCLKITDELSVSAIVRGVENPEKRSMMSELRFDIVDLIYTVVIFSVNAVIIILDSSFTS